MNKIIMFMISLVLILFLLIIMCEVGNYYSYNSEIQIMNNDLDKILNNWKGWYYEKGIYFRFNTWSNNVCNNDFIYKLLYNIKLHIN